MQECHPVAYESRKLNEAERRYTTHEKELLAVVHCLRIWRHYLLGSSFIVRTDNTTVSHFLSQSKLTSKQARWQELLAEFNFMLEYRAGSTNSVADALSRRAELDQVALMAMNAIVRADSRVAINIRKKIKKALTRDPVAQQLLKLIESGKTRQFWQEDGLLMTKGRRKYEGPLTIVKKIGKMAYKVDPPHWWSRQLHPVFHVSMLKPFYEDTADPSRGQIKRQGLKPKAAGKHLGENAQLVVIKDIGHAFIVEKPKELYKHLKAFLVDSSPPLPRMSSPMNHK
ncbi:hypothetical protein RJ639_025869 [Escallonia herrerae]|uniref:Reverse transcriptase RNase H-like domain-containing protein n=1 Tax=Escallonia herrerae TaxID=1293975 RepID=A0AA88UVF7_9ASTE|nr:hypothetical protein RJ639_025869 [Escallonia herrerae]